MWKESQMQHPDEVEVLFLENLKQKPHLVQKHRCTVDAWTAHVWLPPVLEQLEDDWLIYKH